MLFEDVFNAYKKLKASVYFDKTQLSLRNKIVEYENMVDSSIEERLENIAFSLEAEDENVWNSYSEKLLSSICALTLPKKIVDFSKENLIVNDIRDNVVIETPQYYIDMDVEGQILGILWILMIGIKFDSEFYEHSYGNRLKGTIEEENKNGNYSPYLFQPYYEQYESWRDNGLKLAQDTLNKNKDVLIITLDFKSYFYSVDFSKDIFDNFYENISNKKLYVRRVNNFVYNVLRTYSSFFKEFKNRTFLPIGFYPSNVLSNWYLDKFDSGIVNRWNPLYYGRYVDDIIIIEKLEKNSIIQKMVHDINSKKTEIVEYFLCNCKHNTNNSGCNFLLFKKNKSKKDVEYSVNPDLFIEMSNLIRPEIKLQNTKVKIFYFDSKGSDSLITSFRNEIAKNKSEFRTLPEDGTVFIDDDYSEIYSLKYSDTINKFRGVDGATIDKFALSKFLGKYLRIGSLIRDKKESKFIKDIIKIFDDKTVIENYLAWEKVLFYLAVNESLDKYKEFALNVVSIIDKISYPKEKNSNVHIISPNESLYALLYSSISKSLSHIWGVKVKKCICDLSKVINHVINYNEILNFRYGYLKSRMSDKLLMPILIDALIDGSSIAFNDKTPINLSNLSVFLKYSNNLELVSTKYKLYPYVITPLDITMGIILSSIQAETSISSSKIILDKVNNKHFELNFTLSDAYIENYSDYKILSNIDCKEFLTYNIFDGGTIHTMALRIGKLKIKKPLIAIANATLNESDFTSVLTDFPNRTFNRYNRLSKIVNCAIESKANILVLPEAYVPFEWLPLLYRISTKNNMLIITGVEHIKSGNSIYNLTATILPYINKYNIYTYVNFHTKVYYSPEEEREINGYGLKVHEGDSYELFTWNDIWFSIYCCYELASITDRCRFMSYLDLLAAVEWNRDINYYSNIIESLSRDLHCYCVQVNSSDYGDSRITQPSKTDLKDIVKTKGGINDTVLVGEIDIDKLRRFQQKKYELQKDDKIFKPTPPQFDRSIVYKKIKGTLFNDLTDMSE